MLHSILSLLLHKHHVLLHGPGGTGKSHLLSQLHLALNQLLINHSTVASTGISAFHLGSFARTIHSWAGVGIADLNSHQLALRVSKRDDVKLRWRQVRVLIIDELSMISDVLFDKLEYVARYVRENDSFFGGITLVISADFLQLPPVEDNWVFHSKIFQSAHFHVFDFKKGMRYHDPLWFNLLLRIRNSTHTNQDIDILQSRVTAYDDYIDNLSNQDEMSVKPTILYSTKKDVNNYNHCELIKLNQHETIYKAKDNSVVLVKTKHKINLDKYIMQMDEAIDPTIHLRPGAQVMLKVNLDLQRGLVNGARGVVTECNIESVMVLFYGKRTPIKICLHVWKYEDDKIVYTREQIPLILAWASTIHKSQGCTLDFAICDLGSSIFADGQAYVALSRVRSLDGLLIKNLHANRIKANKDALIYVNNLKPVKPPIIGILEPSEKIEFLFGAYLCDMTNKPLRLFIMTKYLDNNIYDLCLIFPTPISNDDFSSIDALPEEIILIKKCISLGAYTYIRNQDEKQLIFQKVEQWL